MDSQSLQLIRALAGDPADRYLSEFVLAPLQRTFDEDVLTVRDLSEYLADPYCCLRALYGHYAFARRGKDRAPFSQAAVAALDAVCPEDDPEPLLEADDGNSLWEAFVAKCREIQQKPMEQMNRGVIAGLAELAQEVHGLQTDCSIATWVQNGVLKTDRLEPQFLRIVDIRGVGPKITSLFLRDVAFVYALEDRIDRTDRLYVQPIDKWIRLLAPYLMDEPDVASLADWVLAGKLCKYARIAGVSGIRFNMGATYFGLREVHAPQFIDNALASLLNDSGLRHP